MAWTMLTIRECDDGGDGVLYPLPNGEVNGIHHEQGDGLSPQTVIATDLELKTLRGDKRELQFKSLGIKAEMRITDCRVTVACSKYDKGGGWIGGGTALVFNGVSKARAAIRRRGKSVVGHVRYPWLSSVLYSPKMGIGDSEQLLVTCKQRVGGEVVQECLYVNFPKTTSAELVAKEIVRRAAAYRLATSADLDADQREQITSLLNPPPKTPEKGMLVGWVFPTSKAVSEATAYGSSANSAQQ